MHTLSTDLKEEVHLILSAQKPQTAWHYEATIHTPEGDIDVLMVKVVDLYRDYTKNCTDQLTIDIMLGQGTYQQKVLAFANELEITLKRTQMDGINSGQPSRYQTPEVVRYRALAMDKERPLLGGKKAVKLSVENADTANVVVARFQLLDLLFEQVRMKTFGGSLRRCTGVDAIHAILGSQCQTIDVSSFGKLLGVDVAPKANPEVREHIVIPHLTPLDKLPRLIDNICGGIYPAGFGYYLQGKHWYLYPLYDFERFTTTENTLTVLIPPERSATDLETTFRVTPTQVIILSSGQSLTEDTTDHQQLKEGNTTAFMDAKRILEGFVDIQGETVKLDATKNVNQFASSVRPTGLQMLKESPNRITNNYLTESAMLAKREGIGLVIKWENSVENLIYPGMPVRILYLKNNVTHTVYGVVHTTDTHTSGRSPTISSPRHTSNTAIGIFVNRLLSKEIPT